MTASAAAVRIDSTDLDGVLLVHPEVYEDERGFLVEQVHRRTLAVLGCGEVVQLNHSRSVRGVIRGLHFQQPNPQGKLVWASRGALFNVAVDVRRGSPGFGRWTAAELSETNHLQMWIPPGFAHGYAALGDVVDCLYACTGPFSPADRYTIAWNDPEIAINWPVEDPVVSTRDAAAPPLSQVAVLPPFVGAAPLLDCDAAREE
jgi:dTDP-4-dehydrorhamnose 3,5-epimerase